MKTITMFCACFLVSAHLAFPQSSGKELKQELRDKVLKEARKEAKSLKKQGWMTMPGELPMEKMIENAWMKKVAEDENGNAMYITADGNGVAQTRSVAEAQALEFAKLQLAGIIESKIASIVSGNIANEQLSTEDAASVTQIVQSSRNIIAQELGYINPAFKLYRSVGVKNTEVQIRIYYDTGQSLTIAKKAIRRDLRERLKRTDEEVDKLLSGEL